MNLQDVSIIPAQEGCRLIYKCDGTLFIDDIVIAWRIETYGDNREELFSSCEPVVIGASTPDSWVGILNPSGMVTTMDGNYDTYREFEKVVLND